jgi:tetratricopeptide (TPR) repeat protein
MAASGTHPEFSFRLDKPTMESSSRSNRWQRLEHLFYSALDLEPDARAAFLDRACGEDAELREEVESLLRADGPNMDFLNQPVLDAAQRIAREDDLSAQRIGAYQLLRLLGEGGMGKVYLAARADDLYRKKVAIKIVQSGLGQSPAMLLRFRSERQILANLEHPNIARLLDGGVTPGGVSYLVMEYVDGIRVDDYCRTNQLGIGLRLRLFCAVCSAVDYAHKNLVVHRDIKPANILVTAEGIPKLLDFGIAKLMDPEMGNVGATLTADRIMTLEYASPEQVRGRPVTTATDVYALGLLLYELLTGQRPLRTDSANPLDLARLICEQIPEPPSLAASSNSESARKLRGEVDNIVLMALRKEPSRRYVSAAAMAADVDAYLTGYPVHARTDAWGYRTGKLIRRHKAGAAATVIVAVALVIFSIGMGLLAQRATRERLAAQREAQFLERIFAAATPDGARGQRVTARELLDQGAQRVDRELAGDPGLRGTMLDAIGRAYSTLGLFDEAEHLLERAYALRLKILGAGSTDVASTLFNLATAIRQQGQYKKAEPFFRQSLAIRERKLGEHNADVAESLSVLGECLYLENRDAEAEPILRKALAIDRELGSNSFSGNYLALLLKRKGNYAEALPLLQEQVEYDKRQLGADSPDYALALHNLAGALIDAGDFARAETTERQALALQRKIMGNDHPDLAYPLNNLGNLLLGKGDWRAAEPLLWESLQLRRRTVGEKSALYGLGLNNWGRLLQQKGDYEQAEKTLKSALDTIVKANGPVDWNAARVTASLGQLEFDRQDYAEAERYARRVLEIAHQLGADENPQAAAALIDLAEARAHQGDPAGAEPLLRRAMMIRQKQFSPGHPNVVGAQVRLGEIFTAEGKASEAEALLRNALASAQSARFPLLSWQIAEVQSALGTCLIALGRADEGEELVRMSRAALQSDPRPAFRQPYTQQRQHSTR